MYLTGEQVAQAFQGDLLMQALGETEPDPMVLVAKSLMSRSDIHPVMYDLLQRFILLSASPDVHEQFEAIDSLPAALTSYHALFDSGEPTDVIKGVSVWRGPIVHSLPTYLRTYGTAEVFRTTGKPPCANEDGTYSVNANWVIRATSDAHKDTVVNIGNLVSGVGKHPVVNRQKGLLFSVRAGKTAQDELTDFNSEMAGQLMAFRGAERWRAELENTHQQDHLPTLEKWVCYAFYQATREFKGTLAYRNLAEITDSTAANIRYFAAVGSINRKVLEQAGEEMLRKRLFKKRYRQFAKQLLDNVYGDTVSLPPTDLES